MNKKIILFVCIMVCLWLIINIANHWVIWWDMVPLFYNMDSIISGIYTRSWTTLLWGILSPWGNVLSLFYVPLIWFIKLFSQYGMIWWLLILLLSFYTSYRFFRYIWLAVHYALLLSLFWILSLAFYYLFARGLLFTQMLLVLIFQVLLLWYQYIDTGKKKYLLYTLWISLFWGVLSSNPWYFIPAMVIVVIMLLRWWYSKKYFAKRVILWLVCLSLTSLISIASFLIFAKNNIAIYEDDRNQRILTQIPLEDQKTSSSLSYTLRWFYGDLWAQWGYDEEGELYNPFPWVSWYQTWLWDILSWIPLFIMIIGMLIIDKDKRKQYMFWLSIFLINLWFFKSAAAPFWYLFEWLMNNIGPFGMFRSPHQKFGIIFVISQCMMLYLLFSSEIQEKLKKYISYALLGYIVFIGYFWFQGRAIPQVNLVSEIPDEYLQTADYINTNNSIKRIAWLPYNVSTRTNTEFGYEWYSLFYYLLPHKQLWNRNDIAFSSYNKLFLDKFGPIFQDVESMKDKNLLQIHLQSLNIDTVIYDGYTDRYPRFGYQENHTGVLQYLSWEGLILEDTFGKITIRRLPERYRTSELYISSASLFSKVNPTKYKLSLTLPAWSTGQELSFLQSFHPEWKLYPGQALSTELCDDTILYSGTTSSTIATESVVRGDTSYRVQRWDTLTTIAAQYNISRAKLISDNQLVGPKWISIGQILKIQNGIIWIKSNNEDISQASWGETTECIRDRYSFFQGEELGYFWKKPVFESTHTLVHDYANGWTINANDVIQYFPPDSYIVNDDGSVTVYLTLYFRPQSRFYLGLGVSGLTLLWLLSWLLRDWKHKRNNSNPNTTSVSSKRKPKRWL